MAQCDWRCLAVVQWKMRVSGLVSACGKLLTGATMSHPGNWTSWPPHSHTATQKEL
jgi:5-deoxy-D-glucuronate isomerase